MRRGGPALSSFTCLYYHVVFGTKERRPLITPDIRPRLYAYVGGIVRDQRGTVLAIGGGDDHVHVLADLDKARTIPDAVRDWKRGSSRWVHEELGDARFGWQTGYAAFTVSVSGLPQVKAYIAGQDEHHRAVTFEEEYRSFLERHGVEYDEQYLWS